MHSSLGKFTGKRLHKGPAGVRFSAEVGELLFSKTSKPAMGERPASCAMETGGYFTEDKAAEA